MCKTLSHFDIIFFLFTKMLFQLKPDLELRELTYLQIYMHMCPTIAIICFIRCPKIRVI